MAVADFGFIEWNFTADLHRRHWQRRDTRETTPFICIAGNLMPKSTMGFKISELIFGVAAIHISAIPICFPSL